MVSFVNKRIQKLSKSISEEGYNVPYSLLMKLFKSKSVKVGGKRVDKDIVVNQGETVELYYTPKLPELCIVYEDKNVVVVNKSAGVYSEEVFRAVLARYNTAFFIHRLDRNTNGIMIFALNSESEKELLNGFKNRTFVKKYLATCYGVPKLKSAVLTAYLVKDDKNSFVKIYDKKVKDSVEIKTGYTVITENGNTCLLEVELFTGKTHQIRAHLAHIGHFILGDGKYGNGEINRQLNQKELMLKAYKLTLYFDNESPLKYLDNKTFEI